MQCNLIQVFSSSNIKELFFTGAWLPACGPVCQERCYVTMIVCKHSVPWVFHINCVCTTCLVSCLVVFAHLFLQGTAVSSYPSVFNLPAWNKPAQVNEAVFIRFFTEFNMGAKQKRAHMDPANNKTCSKRNTKPSSPASLHLTKYSFDVIQNIVYLLSVYTALGMSYVPIGVCVFLCCRREGRR